MKREMPDIYAQLVKYKNYLEQHFEDMQDIEFTIQEKPVVSVANQKRETHHSSGREDCGGYGQRNTD